MASVGGPSAQKIRVPSYIASLVHRSGISMGADLSWYES